MQMPNSANPLSIAAHLSKMTAVYFLFYVLVLNVVLGRNLPSIFVSDVGIAVTGCISFLMLLSVVSFLIASFSENRQGTFRLIAKSFIWLGMLLLLSAIPRSVTGKGTQVFKVGEGQLLKANYLEGLSELQFGDITLESKGYNILLSRKVDVKTAVSTLTGDKDLHIGLFPATRIGPWRLTINKFGYAPFLEWMDENGNPVINNWVMMGTFPRRETDVDLVDWIPIVNLMLGVGYYPPARDDIFSQVGTPYRVYVRIEEATINGVVRDMTDPDAHVFLTDGKIEKPKYFVKVFKDKDVVFEKHLNSGEMAVFPGGQVRLSDNILLWVEIQAQKNPWLTFVKAGLYFILIGLLMSIVFTFSRIAKYLLDFIYKRNAI